MKITLNSFFTNFESNLAFIIQPTSVVFIDKEYSLVHLGIRLSELLLSELPNNRKFTIYYHIKNILSNIHTDFILVDRIEILFNPAYNLDIIELFSKVSRNKKIIPILILTRNVDFKYVYGTGESKYDVYCCT